MPQWVFFFGEGKAEGDPERRDILGGKGASLAAMSRAGLPVPPGFTISAECCRYYFKNDETWPDGLEDEVRTNLKRLEQFTGQSFGKGERPLLVSVRSGAAVSMPGMMDTLLNCGIHPGLADELGAAPRFWQVLDQFVRQFASSAAGVLSEVFDSKFVNDSEETPESAARRHIEIYEEQVGRAFPERPWDQLSQCINAVFRSWNSERAAAYRKRNEIIGLTGTAINVQAMFASDVSGILFTQDPNDLDSGRIVIESSFGLGEAVVSGDVSPDRYRVKQDNFEDMEVTIGQKRGAVVALGSEAEMDSEKASLFEEQVAELCGIGLKVEEHFGSAMDVEWGLAGGKFALLQCRPIRGLDILADVEKGRQDEIARLKKLAGEKRKVWVAHNLGETLRAPTTLTWDIMKGFMSGSGGFGLMYKDFGFRPSDKIDNNGILELVCGRIYTDPDRLALLFWEDMPWLYDTEAVIHDPALLDQAPTHFDPDRTDSTFLFKLPATVLAMMKSAKTISQGRFSAKERFENIVLPLFLKYVRRKTEQDLTSLDEGELLAELNDRLRLVLDEFGKESLKPGFFGGMAFESLQGILVQLLGKDEGASMAQTLVMGLDGEMSVEQNRFLYEVASGERSLGEFLDRFGHRTAGEMELAEPRWREDPSYLEHLIESYRSRTGVPSPQEIHEANASKSREAADSLPDQLAEWGGSSFREEVEEHRCLAVELLPYRETGKHYLMMGYELIRLAILELANRWELGRDIFFLRLEELERFQKEREALIGRIDERKLRWQSAQRLEMPAVIDSEQLDDLGLPQEHEATDELKGDPIAGGTATGTARIVFNPQEATDLGTELILVCPSTDPGWTPLFVHARGLVVERGGVLSHGAIVARDFGIPAVVCPDATKIIKDGEKIRIDGNRGRVSRME